MTKWCSSIWKQRKARLPDSIQILPDRRNAAAFQKERIPWDRWLFGGSGVRSAGQGLGPNKHCSLAQAEKDILPLHHFNSKMVLVTFRSY